MKTNIFLQRLKGFGFRNKISLCTREKKSFLISTFIKFLIVFDWLFAESEFGPTGTPPPSFYFELDPLLQVPSTRLESIWDQQVPRINLAFVNKNSLEHKKSLRQPETPSIHWAREGLLIENDNKMNRVEENPVWNIFLI